jgi:hypothetical protein
VEFGRDQVLVFHSAVVEDADDGQGDTAMTMVAVVVAVVDTSCLYCAWVEVVVVDNHERCHCP